MIPVGAKIGVGEIFYTHVGIYLGSGQVFHNHWRNGTEIISYEQFANGKAVSVLSQGTPDTAVLYPRIQHLLGLRRAYDILRYNCEHAASFVRDGVASSPQLLAYGVTLGIGTVVMLASGRFK